MAGERLPMHFRDITHRTADFGDVGVREGLLEVRQTWVSKSSMEVQAGLAVVPESESPWSSLFDEEDVFGGASNTK